jgi:hypothetical protein
MKLLTVLTQILLFLISAQAAIQAQSISSSFVAASPAHNAESATVTYKYSSLVAVPIPKLSIKRGGFNTSRLSSNNLKKWKSIEKIATQKGQNDQALYPTLQGLWEWAAHSEHTIVVEIIKSSGFQSNSAGSISIESYDPACQSHTVTLKLFLSNIDSALIAATAARKNGFIAFQFLKKEERYVEVLGHELSHAKFILKNNLRTRLVNELVEDTNESILVNAHDNTPGSSTPFLRDRISQRDALLKELEAEAEANEEIIWRELVGTKSKKVGGRR